MRKRVFNIMQYEKHPNTGKLLLTEDKIKEALSHKTIKRWAYCCHNKDRYNKEDYERDNTIEIGQLKPKHYHIVIDLENSALEPRDIARWFGIAENYVECPYGQGAFYDCCKYLTHEDEKELAQGKYRYDDKEIKCNFDFREEISDYILNKKVKKVSKDEVRQKVLNGMPLKEAKNQYPEIFANDISQLEKLNREFLNNIAPPCIRYNFFVSGIASSIGKTSCAKAIAKALYPDIAEEDEIYCIIGTDKVAFENYKGQPVIIWDDLRVNELFEILKSRDNIFRTFDPYPSKNIQHKKFGSVNLVNKYNIITSMQGYTEFFNGIVSKRNDVGTEDENQIYRRIPFILNLYDECYSFWVNKGFKDGTREFKEYYKCNIEGNFVKIRQIIKNEDNLRAVENQLLAIPLQEVKKIENKLEKEDKEDNIEIFKNYGSCKGNNPFQNIEEYQHKNTYKI